MGGFCFLGLPDETPLKREMIEEVAPALRGRGVSKGDILVRPSFGPVQSALEQLSRTPNESRVMVQLDLTSEEREALKDVLVSYLSDLRMEIADTDSLNFREHLKERKALIQKVLDVLQEPSD